MSNNFFRAVKNLKPSTPVSFSGEIETEEDFNKIGWKIGTDENGISIKTTTNPHSELTWTLVKDEMDRLDAEYDALEYARARDRAYPKVKEFMEAYTEKEIGEDSTKWDAYVVKYNKVRSDNQKP